MEKGSFPGGSVVKNLPASRRRGLDLSVGKIPWRRKWQSTPVFLAWEIPWTEESGGLQSMESQKYFLWYDHILSGAQNC